jgi:hypothetical protein
VFRPSPRSCFISSTGGGEGLIKPLTKSENPEQFPALASATLNVVGRKMTTMAAS